jgi:CPA1 family monovalent cation:H+ antiporter
VDLFVTVATLLALSGLFRFLNERHWRLETTIGLMLQALVLTFLLAVLSAFGTQDYLADIRDLVSRLSLDDTLLNGVLCFMLFAGSVDVKLRFLEEEKWVILSLAVGATLIAWAVTGLLLWTVAGMFGILVRPVYLFLFGALISPTDPIAALAILGKVGLPKRLEAIINGESLFNDGVGVVLFTMCLAIATQPVAPTVTEAVNLFLREVIGGVGLGLAAAALAHAVLLRTGEYGSQVLISLAVVAAGYVLAEQVEVSGPIAMVVTGLVVGNFTRPSMRETVRAKFDTFWKGIDEVLNDMLFVLIGLNVVLVHPVEGVPAGLIAIVVCLAARAISVLLPMFVLNATRTLRANPWELTRLLTWAGLRGGLAIALALSIPPAAEKSSLLYMTYAVVSFALVVQGLTIGRFFKPDKLARLLK